MVSTESILQVFTIQISQIYFRLHEKVENPPTNEALWVTEPCRGYSKPPQLQWVA
jgi:hypothetical protein